MLRIVNLRNGEIVANEVEIARSLLRRLFGLIRRTCLPEGSALVIPGCRQVHTLFMRFPIDVVFIGAGGRVVCLVESLKPYRISSYCPDAERAVELPAGAAARLGLRIGDVLAMEGTIE